MSQTSTQTTYSLNGGTTTANGGDIINITFSSLNGIDDAIAIAVAEALKAVPWPAGVAFAMAISKNQTTNVSWFSDGTTDPIELT